MSNILLSGCTCEPLINYLKALGSLGVSFPRSYIRGPIEAEKPIFVVTGPQMISAELYPRRH